MALVNVGTYKKLIPALGEAFGQFPAYPVGVLRGDLSGFERLPDMVCQHFLVAGRLAAPGVSVQLPGQQHFSGGGGRIAAARRYPPAAVRLGRVQDIVYPFCQGNGGGFPLTGVHGNNAGGRHASSPPFTKSGARQIISPPRPAGLFCCQIDFNI